MVESRYSVSRREFLRYSGVAAGAFAVPASLAACGGGKSSPTADGDQSAGTPRRGGVLRVGYPGGSSSDTQDPMAGASELTSTYGYAMFEGLTAQSYSGETVPQLAEFMEPSGDSRVWDIRVREDVHFHDGRVLSADDVIYSLARMRTLPTSTAGQFVAPVNPRGLRKLDVRTVRVTLDYPFSILNDTLAAPNTLIVPVGFDVHKPIGTGPFKYQSFTPGVEANFTANRDWWGGFEHQTGGPYVDELRIVDINDDNARVNALLSGEVDAIADVPLAQISDLGANPNMRLFVSKAGNWRPFTMRVDIPPFNDVRVRQAMRLIADRPQLISNALVGNGHVANDLYSPSDPLSIASDLPQRHQDIEQAKSLLKSAGQEDLRVTLTTSAIEAGIVPASEVFVNQAASAGVTVKTNEIDPSSFYGPGYPNYTFGVDYFDSFPYLMTAAQVDAPGSQFNDIHWHDPQFSSLWLQALSTQNEAHRKEITREMQMIEWNTGGYIIWGYVDAVDGGSSHVHGFRPHPAGNAFGHLWLYHFWLE